MASDPLRELDAAGQSVWFDDRGEEVHVAIEFDDAGLAADVFAPVHAATGGADGFASIEVSPHLAYDAEQAVAEALRLWERLGIDLEEVAERLEREGVQKFVEPFDRLRDWLDESAGADG